MTNTTLANERRITSATVREFCGGVSDMWIWRRLKSDPSFPRPVYVGRRRFWLESEMRNWWANQPTTCDELAHLNANRKG